MGSRLHVKQIKHGPPLDFKNDIRAYKKEYAQSLDKQDPLRHLRDEFIIPSKADLRRRTLKPSDFAEESSEPSIYLCGNSLGLQPKRTRERVDSHLSAWATKGVTGHYDGHEDSPLPGFLYIDDKAAELAAPVVGASEDEVAVMGNLTSNLHLLMCSFYRPTKERYRIILEAKAFPSDHYAVESQIINHGFDPRDAMILIEPTDPPSPMLSTEQITSMIDEHAESTALVLLPGIQYYSGQYFDIARITAHAHSKGVIIGWDCAHAVGNVELKLHEWDVDFAVWCNYKYMNSGPGAIGGLFVHEKHGKIEQGEYRPRLSGWWGGQQATRFEMKPEFAPRPGAKGYQISNPSALDLTAVVASLEIFGMTSMSELRKKSLHITGYLEHILLKYPLDASPEDKPFTIITSSNPEERGAQLSIRLEPGLLDSVLEDLEDNGVVIDERKPNVIRVAPAPLYNTYEEVWEFVQIFLGACRKAVHKKNSVIGKAWKI